VESHAHWASTEIWFERSTLVAVDGAIGSTQKVRPNRSTSVAKSATWMAAAVGWVSRSEGNQCGKHYDFLSSNGGVSAATASAGATAAAADLDFCSPFKIGLS